MGKYNTAMCSYLAKPEIFADFINGSQFGGAKRVLPGQMMEREAVYIQKEGHKKNNAVERRRDIVKALCNGEQYMIIGVENQSEIDPSMPLRCMEYDVMEYRSQLHRLKEQNRREMERETGRVKDTKRTNGEFLSGIQRKDKLNPVMTIVFYHGKDTYDGCRMLHDMLNLKEENAVFKEYVADYKMNLVTLEDLQEENFATGLRDLIGFMKRSQNKQALKAYCMENADRLSRMDEDTFQTISVMTHLDGLIKPQEEHRQGGIDMCKAIEEMIADGRQEGIEQGIKALIEVCKDFGISKEEVSLKIMQKFRVDTQQSQNYVKRYWDEAIQYH